MNSREKSDLPATAKQAEKRGFKKIAKIDHDSLSKRDKRQWAKVQVSPAAAPRKICYYDPNTGAWDDCHEVT